VAECVCDAVGRKYGRLLKGDIADVKMSAKIMLSDFHRGNMCWFIECDKEIKQRENENTVEGEGGDVEMEDENLKYVKTEEKQAEIKLMKNAKKKEKKKIEKIDKENIKNKQKNQKMPNLIHDDDDQL